MIAIDQLNQRFSKGFHTSGGSFSVGKMQPRGGGDAVSIVAGRAAGVLENRVNAVGKRDFLSERGPRQTQQSDQDSHGDSLPQTVRIVPLCDVGHIFTKFPKRTAAAS